MKYPPDPGVAAVLSLLVPGTGQFYTREIRSGVVWLLVTPIVWLGSGGLLGWVCHVLAARAAYRRARRTPGG